MNARAARLVLDGALFVATLIAWMHAVDAIRSWV